MTDTPLSHASSAIQFRHHTPVPAVCSRGCCGGRGTYDSRPQHTSQRFINSEDSGTGGKYGNRHIDYA